MLGFAFNGAVRPGRIEARFKSSMVAGVVQYLELLACHSMSLNQVLNLLQLANYDKIFWGMIVSE